MAIDELYWYRNRRSIFRSDAGILDSAESWLGNVTDRAFDTAEDVLTLAFFRVTIWDIVTEKYDDKGMSASNRALQASNLPRATSALASLLAKSVDPRAVLEAVDEMRARTAIVLPPRAPIRTLLNAARKVGHVPVMMAALEAVYALDVEDLRAVEAAAFRKTGQPG